MKWCCVSSLLCTLNLRVVNFNQKEIPWGFTTNNAQRIFWFSTLYHVFLTYYHIGACITALY